MNPPEEPKRNMLTHKRVTPKPVAPVKTEPVVAAQVPDKDLTQKIEIDEGTGMVKTLWENRKLEEGGDPNHEKRKAASSLPEAMARVHRQHQEDEIRERLWGGGSSRGGSSYVVKNDDLKVADPDPGLWKSILMFIFAFGVFAKGVLLMQPLPVSLLFWMLCGLGSIHWSMGWLMPVPGPGTVYTSLFTSQVLAGGMLIGMGLVFFISLILYVILWKKTGGIGKFYGMKLVVNAFLPLAIGQLALMTYCTYKIGEAYWRGNVPEGYDFLVGWVLPGLWIWGGYRVAQAICGLFRLRLLKRFWLKSGITLVLAVPVLIRFTGWQLDIHQHVRADWQDLKAEALSSTKPLPLSRYQEFESRIPFRAVELKNDFYLYRMQYFYWADRMEVARADALLLDRMALPGSAEDETAKGLNFLFQNRLDLAVPRLKKALQVNESYSPAHQWLALALATREAAEAEEHAWHLMEAEPNVFHLQLLVRILYRQKEYQQIWDAMLLVNAPPEQWDPVTLHQGSVAAFALDKTKRAEFLFALARKKGFESGGE